MDRLAQLRSKAKKGTLSTKEAEESLLLTHWPKTAGEGDLLALVSSQLKSYRAERGLTVGQLALESGISSSRISQLEGAYETRLRIETLLRVAEATDSVLEISFRKRGA